ncbi:MAG: hypothetical protein IKO72_01550 [Kiritimatiellae bacterium]|nr:hypothetical protein [Kiritimatiellia bacterium]
MKPKRVASPVSWSLIAIVSLTFAMRLFALDNTVSNEFWDTRQYVNAQGVPASAMPISMVDSRQTNKRASENSSGAFSTFVPGTLLFIR